MGLDTTHDCWHGPYSSFNHWRRKLAEVAGYGKLDDYIGFGGEKTWPDNSDPLQILLNHSDCDGNIPASQCDRLAEALEDVMPSMKRADDAEVAPWSMYLEPTVNWIVGLREAADADEPVEFH